MVIHSKESAGAHGTFEVAVKDAIERFGSAPCPIREAGGPPITLSASTLLHYSYKADIECVYISLVESDGIIEAVSS